jgi:Pyruvate/2-oxoacid:ferredoxin oxidoreductase delta subunit
MIEGVYRQLAQRLDSLPNGYPSTDDGVELRILVKLFSTAEAELAANLRLTLETPKEIANRLGRDRRDVKPMLKKMAQKRLIRAGRADGGLGYGLLPFAVGIYEYQIEHIDAEFAALFEAYYQQSYKEVLKIGPAFHRIVPVNETVRNDMEVQPYESASAVIENAKAWGVVDCICRVQKQLIGDPCEHPIDVCMIFNQRPGAFDHSPIIRALTKDEAQATLKRAADAGLVHSVSNSKDGDTHFHTYICNCCTCSCGILRGMADLGIANVVARSAFVNSVDPDVCVGCESCIEYCQFDALSLEPADPYIQINEACCVGCGVCVPVCPDGALSLVRRPDEDVLPIPKTHDDWLQERADARGIDLSEVL